MDRTPGADNIAKSRTFSSRQLLRCFEVLSAVDMECFIHSATSSRFSMSVFDLIFARNRRFGVLHVRVSVIVFRSYSDLSLRIIMISFPFQ